MKRPSYRLEKQKLGEGFSFVIGCDEVGRGCLAGPIVAAAVVLNPDLVQRKWYRDIRDSKLVSPANRALLAEKIKAECLAFGIGVVAPKKIDEINIHHASLLAMSQAVANLSQGGRAIIKSLEKFYPRGTGYLLVDGKFKVPNVAYEQEALIDGDAYVLSISAASIVAKVYRDELMVKLHDKFPVYNFAQHKGYATSEHRLAIKQNGLTAIHRLSFCGNI